MSKLTRRDFIRSSMAVGAGLAMVGPTSRVLGANDDIRLGIIGVGGQGGGHMGYFSKIPRRSARRDLRRRPRSCGEEGRQL